MSRRLGYQPATGNQLAFPRGRGEGCPAPIPTIESSFHCLGGGTAAGVPTDQVDVDGTWWQSYVTGIEDRFPRQQAVEKVGVRAMTRNE